MCSCLIQCFSCKSFHQMTSSIFQLTVLAICLDCTRRRRQKTCELSTGPPLRKPQWIDGTTPTCARLPPQPHPRRLIKRDTLSPLGPACKGSCRPMLCTLAARQNRPRLVSGCEAKTQEEEAGDTICILQQVIEAFGDAV